MLTSFFMVSMLDGASTPAYSAQRWFGSGFISAGGWSTKWFHYRTGGGLLPVGGIFAVSAITGVTAIQNFDA